MSTRWARKRALLDARDISKLPSRKVHLHSVHYQLLTLIVAISSPFSLHHNSSFPKTSSLTATEHGRTDSSACSLLVPVSLSTPLRRHCQQCPRRPPCIYLLETFISRTSLVCSTFLIFFSFMFYPQAVGLDPVHYLRRRHLRRRTEYILRRSLISFPSYPSSGSHSTPPLLRSGVFFTQKK